MASLVPPPLKLTHFLKPKVLEMTLRQDRFLLQFYHVRCLWARILAFFLPKINPFSNKKKKARIFLQYFWIWNGHQDAH